MASPEALDEAFHRTAIVLGYVKEKIGDQAINPHGDLAKILAVIKIKTGVDYYRLESTAEFRKKIAHF